ncbi:hypothetical protein OH77DRAFT_1421274 [Trametes cingulata]|nr:hypothetical protein OH77DRAFT_1421274 [Trametes cingulata]
MALDIEYPSFYRDAPVQISTPPRRQRSATVGVWARGLMPQIDADPPPPVHSFRYDSDVDMTDSSRAGSPTDSRFSRANPPRRRRRTIVHLPSDSLFSSSLDFSALMSETERFPRPPASDGSRSPELAMPVVDSDLAPAFSLHNSPADRTRRASSDTVTVARRGSSGLGSPSGADDTKNAPVPPPSSPSCGPPPAGTPSDIDGDELLDLFSVLGLDEDEKWGGVGSVDDSGIAFALPSAHASLASSKGARVRRKRGDTIRASDFSKMPASASFDGSSSSGLAGSARIPPRRTRSGTVTQATSSGSGRRKHDGWPTIKMRTTEEPLRVDGEDADDELLLKDGDVVE